jgi:anti-anti-sigma factor
MLFNVRHILKDEAILSVDGSLSGEAVGEFQRQMDELIAGGCKTIILDVSKMSTINSAAMGKIVHFRNKLNEQQRSIKIRGCSESLYKTFLMIKFDTLMSIEKGSESISD